MNYADNDGNPRIPLFEFKELNYGPAGYDRTHNLQTYWVWDLPFGTDRHWATRARSGAARRLAVQRRDEPHERHADQHHPGQRASTSTPAAAVSSRIW